MKKLIYLTPIFAFILFIGCAGDLSQMKIAISNGGRAVSVTINPSDANKIVVASETGGLFKSTKDITTFNVTTSDFSNK